MTTRQTPRSRAAAACIAAVTVIAGCNQRALTRHPSVAPMNKPVALGSNPGTGAVESARREFQGTWTLVTLEMEPPGGGTLVPVQASGTLTYDDFGNLTIEGSTTDPSAPAAAREVSMLSFKGRAVIDVVKKELKMMDVTGNVDPDEVLSPDRRRRYELDADSLKLSSFDERGDVTMISTWHRVK